MKDCKIDVKEKHLVFDVKDVYYLEKKLDYEVVEDQASAKFDRKRKELKIVLPIVQVKEVVHQIPDDVPLEVDDVEENVEVQESVREGHEVNEDQDKVEGGEMEVRESQQGVGKVQEVVESDEKEREVEGNRVENRESEKENIEVEIKNTQERLEGVNESDEKKLVSAQVSAKVVKPQPCCIKLNCALLYSLS